MGDKKNIKGMKNTEKEEIVAMSNRASVEEDKIYEGIKTVLLNSHNNIARVVNSEMVNAYWNIGKYIFEAQGEKERADYGTYLIKYLSKRLTKEFGNGYSEQSLRNMRQFYECFPISSTLWSESKKETRQIKEIHQTLSVESDINQIGHTVCAQSNNCPKYLLKLSWSHLRTIMRVPNQEKRNFYIKECSDSNWSVRQLERQINSFYYERLLVSPNKDKVRNEIQETEPNTDTPLTILKDPYVLEFLNMKENKDYLERDIETKIMDNLQKFILEMGKGFAFIGRQYRISIDNKNYYIDLVFYNIILKCYVLIDLKTTELDHGDIGQMDFYTRYFEMEIKQKDDNPTIGIILCSDKSKAMVKYTMLNDSKQIFASKYTLYLPTEEELTKYIKEQRELLERELPKRCLTERELLKRSKRESLEEKLSERELTGIELSEKQLAKTKPAETKPIGKIRKTKAKPIDKHNIKTKSITEIKNSQKNKNTTKNE
jgi:predicted nuclease of restriction endonuclease-like (RecB) superfamily